MTIWLYTLTYNEAHFVKNFLRAYSKVDKIIVYDNESTDNTVELLKQDPRVEVRINDSGGEIRDDIYLQIKNNCWKEARGKADWVIIVDFDEIFTRAIYPDKFDLDLSDLGYFAASVDIIKPHGYMVYEAAMPVFKDFNPLEREIKAVYDVNSEKMCCFRPDHIREINYSPGCHHANPVCMNALPPLIHWSLEFKLLHFKYINAKVYFSRLAQYAQRMSKYNLETGFGVHYTWSLETHSEIYKKGLKMAKPLFEIEKP